MASWKDTQIGPSLTLSLKFMNAVKKNGISYALKKARRYLFQPLREQKMNGRIFHSANIEDRFTEIYKLNYWGSRESVSGPGSTMEYTELVRRQLPTLFNDFSIKTVFDAPCGDFKWMSLVLNGCNISYVGGDIVKPLIDALNTQNTDTKSTFIHLDITKDPFPGADLWICRDCLFHLSFDDTRRAIEMFIDSGIPYVLTTTHKNIGGFENHDISTGAFRFMDLFSSPYFFPRDVLFRFDDYIGETLPREMCLWSREQVIDSLKHSARLACGQGSAQKRRPPHFLNEI